MSGIPPKVKFRSELGERSRWDGELLPSKLYLKMSGEQDLIIKVRNAIREVLQANIKMNEKEFTYNGE